MHGESFLHSDRIETIWTWLGFFSWLASNHHEWTQKQTDTWNLWPKCNNRSWKLACLTEIRKIHFSRAEMWRGVNESAKHRRTEKETLASHESVTEALASMKYSHCTTMRKFLYLYQFGVQLKIWHFYSFLYWINAYSSMQFILLWEYNFRSYCSNPIFESFNTFIPKNMTQIGTVWLRIIFQSVKFWLMWWQHLIL